VGASNSSRRFVSPHHKRVANDVRFADRGVRRHALQRWPAKPIAGFDRDGGAPYAQFIPEDPRISESQEVAGDEGVGFYQPPLIGSIEWMGIPDEVLDRVRALDGAASTAADVLDELGLAMVTNHIVARHVPSVVVGRVHTLAYLPERRAPSDPALREEASKLAHHRVFEIARPGDVLVIDARGLQEFSVLGGMAAHAARQAGLSGCIVDGAARDLDEWRAEGIALWSRWMTPRTGKWRAEAVAINQPVLCGGVHVQPGDVVVADETGICFVPGRHAERTLRRIVHVSDAERRQRHGWLPANGQESEAARRDSDPVE
jgi:regulator of RNase E activity RraA